MYSDFMEKKQFNEILRQQTEALSICMIRIYARLPETDKLRIVGKQLIYSLHWVQLIIEPLAEPDQKQIFC